MKLSIILPCFNGASTIAVQLEALTRQRWAGEWEVVVVNNGSTDGSMAIVEGYRARLPSLTIVEAHDFSGPRRGVTHSYTVGFAAARGDAFLLCEADDEVGDGWLAGLASALQTHEFVAAALEYERLNPSWLVPKGWRQQDAGVGLSTISSPLHLPYGSGCSLGLRREVYERVGPIDEGCGASWDTDYCWRANLLGIALHFEPSAVIHYRLRDAFGDSYRQGKSWAKAHLVLNRKYGPAPSDLQLLKRRVRRVRDLLRHTSRLLPALRSKSDLRFWCWGFGWCIGELYDLSATARRADRQLRLSAGHSPSQVVTRARG
jgi:glycosyltransferase involved in cell wall biosynthesis